MRLLTVYLSTPTPSLDNESLVSYVLEGDGLAVEGTVYSVNEVGNLMNLWDVEDLEFV